jgi:hypothetical protein
MYNHFIWEKKKNETKQEEKKLSKFILKSIETWYLKNLTNKNSYI